MGEVKHNGFWTEGQDHYKEALKKEEQEQLDPLEQIAASEHDPIKKQSLLSRIKKTKSIYRKKRKDADHHLF